MVGRFLKLAGKSGWLSTAFLRNRVIVEQGRTCGVLMESRSILYGYLFPNLSQHAQIGVDPLREKDTSRM